MLVRLENELTCKCIYRLCCANADGDNLLLDGMFFPLLRQQSTTANKEFYLCLSDFVRPLSSGKTDTVGVFAATVTGNTNSLYTDDPYQHLLVQTLADRLAEAATEKMHEYIPLSIAELLQEKFQGIRPAVGYPSLPDQSVNFLIDQLLDLEQIGITLTTNGAMHPHASVSGLMLAHPAARYFSVGHIDQEQLEDYARRRGMPIEQMRKFLSSNLE